jgi:hypothetical protein
VLLSEVQPVDALSMAETTTIEITRDQKRQLDERKAYDGESYKAVLQRLLEQTDE